MDPKLERALEDLHDLRQFVLNNATQWRMGASHHNPIWTRIAETLAADNKNDGPGAGSTSDYFRYDPAYYLR